MKQVDKNKQQKIDFFQGVIKNKHYCPWYNQFKDEDKNKELIKNNNIKQFIDNSIKQFNAISNNAVFIVQPIDDIDTASIKITLEKTKTDEFIKKLNDWLEKIDNNLVVKTEAHKDKIKQKREKQAQRKKAKKDLKDLFLKKRCFFR